MVTRRAFFATIAAAIAAPKVLVASVHTAKPTMFVAGSLGPEQFAFTGQMVRAVGCVVGVIDNRVDVFLEGSGAIGRFVDEYDQRLAIGDLVGAHNGRVVRASW